MAISNLVSKSKSLKIGQSGAEVAQLQLALKHLGYALTGTGYFGTQTDIAVEAFQKRAGLYPDGEVGPLTASAIDFAVAGNVPPAAPMAEISRPLWLEAGLKYLGTHEGVGAKDNDVIIDWAKDIGGNIAKAYTHDSIPWCALFANVCLAMAGLKGTGSLLALDFAGKWPSVRLIGPAVGAFAPMVRDGGGHIIQIVGKDQHGNVMGLGGNQRDQVSIVPFANSRLNKGFWWPASVPLPSKIGFSALPVVRSDGRLSTNEA
jgi:uncharacterized protein (TIGR02594 family)